MALASDAGQDGAVGALRREGRPVAPSRGREWGEFDCPGWAAGLTGRAGEQSQEEVEGPRTSLAPARRWPGCHGRQRVRHGRQIPRCDTSRSGSVNDIQAAPHQNTAFDANRTVPRPSSFRQPANDGPKIPSAWAHPMLDPMAERAGHAAGRLPATTLHDTGSGLRRHRAYQPGYRQMVARMCHRGQIVVL